jgi:hypothetical protein
MDRKKKLEVLLFWIIRIVSLVLLGITFYVWLKS